MLLILIPLAHGGLLGSWWRTRRPARAVGWLLASFIVLSLAAAVIARLPTAAAVAVAGLVGVLNARAWYGVAAAVTRQEAPRPAPAAHPWAGVLGRPWTTGGPAPVSPFAATTALALILGLTRLGFVLDGHAPEVGGSLAMPPKAVAPAAGPGGPAAGTTAGAVTSPVLGVAGFWSSPRP